MTGNRGFLKARVFCWLGWLLALCGPMLALPTQLQAEDTAIVSIPDGFKVERLYVVPRDQGSWIRMTIDPEGRFIVSQEGGALLRVTISERSDKVEVEKLDAPVRFAMGLLCAFNSLYVNADGPDGTGMYRLRDRDGDDQYEDIQLLKKWKGSMHDHGPHEILMGPDQHLYVLNGNFVEVPDIVSTRSAHRNFQEDLLLPRQWDATGWAVGVKAPGATVYRTDENGSEWELFCGGMRNPYGFDFNSEGELFAFDSDMERHVGTPWERMTRITHCVSGGEYGWRGGTAKGPTYYPDHLPGTVEIGLSSPTGVRFGTKSHFPPRYQEALFALDWQYGRILAVHLKPEGATFSGEFEEFITGRPLNVTDLAFADDGAMYFITGGRSTQSNLYRVTYTGPEDSSRDDVLRVGVTAKKARSLRRQLEAFHGQTDPQAVEFAWPHLDSPDRWIRYAARIAIEHQDLSLWKDRALTEERTDASLTALLALARCADKSVLPEIISRLEHFSWDDLTEARQLNLLRIYTLAFSRLGPPNEATSAIAMRRLSSHYPAPSFSLNRELSELLVYLKEPNIVARTMDLFRKTDDQKEEIHFAFVLRHQKDGWTLRDRKDYFQWFTRAVKFKGGISVPGFIRNIRTEALATLTPAEKKELEPILQAGYLAAVPPPRQLKFVRSWKVEDLASDMASDLKSRSRQEGRKVFEKVQCLACHHFAGEGGTIGPDITSAVSRYSRRDLLESILLPSKAVSDQYRDTVFLTTAGKVVTGRVMREEDGTLFVKTDPFKFELTEIAKSDIESTHPSTTSTMPKGLLDSLTREEILDLLAYIESGADLSKRPFTKYHNFLTSAELTSNFPSFDHGVRGKLEHMIYDTQKDEFVEKSEWHEYGVGYGQDLGVVPEEKAAWWQAEWEQPVQGNTIVISGCFSNQPQPETAWKIELRRDGEWITHARGIGGWYDGRRYTWGGPGTSPIQFDAIRVSLFSKDEKTSLKSILFRGEQRTSCVVAERP